MLLLQKQECFLDQSFSPKNFSFEGKELCFCVWPSFLDVLLGLGPMLWAPTLLGEALNITRAPGPSIPKPDGRSLRRILQICGTTRILTPLSLPLKRFLGSSKSGQVACIRDAGTCWMFRGQHFLNTIGSLYGNNVY